MTQAAVISFTQNSHHQPAPAWATVGKVMAPVAEPTVNIVPQSATAKVFVPDRTSDFRLCAEYLPILDILIISSYF
jgi:hypothetical protein